MVVTAGLLTLDQRHRRNPFAGRIIEIEGMGHLTVEQAFELTDATAERSATAATIALSEQSVEDHLRSGAGLLRSLIDEGYGDAAVLARRAAAMEHWLKQPSLLAADPGRPIPPRSRSTSTRSPSPQLEVDRLATA
ncbi:MAG: hypothetical protein OEW29_19185 [Acidimicrobiia bacterium]|nr:hypothetical protein [Acidimicrobiia bacterium]MDH4366135.1 hypothetical protein [Acidimicrobiia bacterium]